MTSAVLTNPFTGGETPWAHRICTRPWRPIRQRPPTESSVHGNEAEVGASLERVMGGLWGTNGEITPP